MNFVLAAKTMKPAEIQWINLNLINLLSAQQNFSNLYAEKSSNKNYDED